MKTLLLTLLFFVGITGVAQKPFEHIEGLDEMYVCKLHGDTGCPYFYCIHEAILIKQLNEYSEHCYNDSTLVTYNCYWYGHFISGYEGDTVKIIGKENDFDLGINPAYVGKTKEWIHKEPKFEDFIKWINTIHP